MTPATSDADEDVFREQATVHPATPGATVCGLACAACAGLMWVAGWFGTQFLIPGPGLFPAGDSLVEWAAILGGIGAAVGFLVGAIAASILERRGSVVLVWSLGTAFATAVGGALSVAAVAVADGFIPQVIASSLGFSVAGLLFGVGGHLWNVAQTRPASTTPRDRIAPLWTFLGAAGWGVAGAALAAVGCAAGTTLGQATMGVNWVAEGSGDGPSVAALRGAALGGASGLLVGALAGALFGTPGRGFSNRPEAALTCAVWGVISAGIGGGLSSYAVVQLAGVVPGTASAALGFSATGLLLGVGAYAVSWSKVPGDEPEADDEEMPVQSPVAGKAVIGTRPPRSGFAWSGLRLLPTLGVSLAALVTAALIDSRDAAIALVAVGLLGLTVVPVLWDQERRLRDLERRDPRPPPSEPEA